MQEANPPTPEYYRRLREYRFRKALSTKRKKEREKAAKVTAPARKATSGRH